ncbi:MAG: ATP-binding protein [Clostridia bacterium]|nr:ATP-binding protein [Clostridia bacterium]
MKAELNSIALKLSSLSVFRKILDTREMKAFLSFLSCDGDLRTKLGLYGEFVYSLAVHGNSFSEFLKKAVCEDENIYIISKAKKKDIPCSVESNLSEELSLFTLLSELTPEKLFEGEDYEGYIPLFENEKTDFKALYKERTEKVDTLGYGIFASKAMFKVEDGEIVPVDSADEISLDFFVGYEKERETVEENTVALLEGRDAVNVLLCGDAGTGKSSTVKALVNHYFSYGLRLIEIRKDQLFSLSHIMGKIADNPLKFIIFIDDLSFNKNDDCFSMLKAALEGSASAKAKNALIYATSNRRHIVKESFADRGGDDIHRNDTVQELLSLSDRFGLTVYFQKPNKILYLDIVHALAQRKGIRMDEKELEVKAEAFALAKGSRSPRVAEQFIKNLR